MKNNVVVFLLSFTLLGHTPWCSRLTHGSVFKDYGKIREPCGVLGNQTQASFTIFLALLLLSLFLGRATLRDYSWLRRPCGMPGIESQPLCARQAPYHLCYCSGPSFYFLTEVARGTWEITGQGHRPSCMDPNLLLDSPPSPCCCLLEVSCS